MRYFYTVMVLLLLSGCAPVVLTSGPHGVAIDPVLMFPNMNKIQELADAECAKYNRIARQQIPRASARNQTSWAIGTPQTGSTTRGNMYRGLIIAFDCIDRPVESVPSIEWPQLPQIVP